MLFKSVLYIVGPDTADAASIGAHRCRAVPRRVIEPITNIPAARTEP